MHKCKKRLSYFSSLLWKAKHTQYYSVQFYPLMYLQMPGLHNPVQCACRIQIEWILNNKPLSFLFNFLFNLIDHSVLYTVLPWGWGIQTTRHNRDQAYSGLTARSLRSTVPAPQVRCCHGNKIFGLYQELNSTLKWNTLSSHDHRFLKH